MAIAAHHVPAHAEGHEGTPALAAALSIPRAWVCPLVVKLCTAIAEAPSSAACSACTLHQVWHSAEHVDRRFWY